MDGAFVVSKPDESNTGNDLIRFIRVLVVLGALAGALYSSACRRDVKPAGKTYALRGTIVSLDAQSKTATIKHEKIGDWMDAMTMEFPVRNPAEFVKLQPGEKITATVHTRPDTFEYWITDIHPEAP